MNAQRVGDHLVFLNMSGKIVFQYNCAVDIRNGVDVAKALCLISPGIRVVNCLLEHILNEKETKKTDNSGNKRGADPAAANAANGAPADITATF